MSSSQFPVPSLDVAVAVAVVTPPSTWAMRFVIGALSVIVLIFWVAASIFVPLIVIVIGVISVLVAVVVLVIVLWKRRRNRVVGGASQGPHIDEPHASPPQHLEQHDVVVIMPLPRGISSKPLLSPVHVPTPPASPSPNRRLGSGIMPHLSLPSSISFGFSKTTFTYEELATATDAFSNTNLLGQGGFGYVHKGILPNGREVAIKHLKDGSRQGEREFRAEVEIISRIHHRHLVSLVGYCISGTQRMLVYEFVANNTLEFHLHGEGRPTMSWEIRMRIAISSAKGLAYLHEDCQPKVIHRDIKASNILLNHNSEAKVGDFGLAKFFPDDDTHVTTRVMGTFGYLAPEYASTGKLTDKSDVFSFGVMLLELITGRRPIDKTHSFTNDCMVEWARPLLTKALEDGNYDTIVDPKLQNYDSGEMGRMVACAAICVRHSARLRPRMSQIVRALEGNISLDNLNEGIIPGHSTIVIGSYGSSNIGRYNEDVTSEYGGSTGEYSLHPFGSTSEDQQTT